MKKVICIKCDNTLNDSLYVSFASKSLIVNIFLQFLIDYIVLNNEMSFHKLLQLLLKRNVINLSECVQPFKLCKKLVKCSLPISRIFKLILNLFWTLRKYS
jgi:hypothetical protein